MISQMAYQDPFLMSDDLKPDDISRYFLKKVSDTVSRHFLRSDDLKPDNTPRLFLKTVSAR